MIDKLNIYLPESASDLIKKDCFNFRILKANDTPNVNDYITRLLCGYHSAFQEELDQEINLIIDNITNELHFHNDRKLKEIASNIVYTRFNDLKAKPHGNHISYKPVRKTESFFMDPNNDSIEDYDIEKIQSGQQDPDSYFPNNFSRSNYLRGLILQFLNLSMAEREKYLFLEQYEELVDRCSRKKAINIKLKTEKVVRSIIPYKVEPGETGLYNYLVCAERTKENTLIISSYHLCDITFDKVLTAPKNMPPLTKEMIALLKKTLKNGPNHIYLGSQITRVQFTKDGCDLFKKIYTDRPHPMKKEKQEDGSSIYTFDCPQVQLFRYFRRFGPDAKILEPESLKEELIQFYKDSLKNYED